jgi:3-hydroxyacyl-CoA dehydrogenase
MFDAEVSHIIEASATFQRLTRQPLSDDAVIERCLLAAINACAAELERARRLKKDEIDAVWTRELGFPPWKGGPLFQAEQMGLVHVVERLAAIHARRNTLGAPSEVLARTAARHDILR